jgi:hypothetical protein
MKTVHERQEEKKQAKLALMQQQVKAGTLVIRKMTTEERAKARSERSERPAKAKRR